MPIDELVQKFGITVGLLLYFIWRDYKTTKEYNDYIKQIASQAVAAINKSTEVDEKMLAVTDRLEKRLDRNASTRST